VVEGSRNKVKYFMEFLKISPQWRFYSGSKLLMGADEMRIDYFFDENPYMKPTIPTAKKISKVTLTSEDGKKIEITLLNAEVINMANGSTYIHGKSYDIYTTPKNIS
jgi:hypothetical protein